jgi:hypothetical protein
VFFSFLPEKNFLAVNKNDKEVPEQDANSDIFIPGPIRLHQDASSLQGRLLHLLPEDPQDLLSGATVRAPVSAEYQVLPGNLPGQL